MTNPELLVTTLDGFLDHKVSFVLYGRSSIALGFTSPPATTAATLDLDSILPLSTWPALQADDNFWDAVEKTNLALSPKGLYISHLFDEEQVFLRPDWLAQAVPIREPSLRFLRLSRPATLDLILTKMMRGDDPQDMEDVAFLIRHDSVTRGQLELSAVRAFPILPSFMSCLSKPSRVCWRWPSLSPGRSSRNSPRRLRQHASALRIAFCACSRFSASSKIVCACASNVSAVISFPR